MSRPLVELVWIAWRTSEGYYGDDAFDVNRARSLGTTIR